MSAKAGGSQPAGCVRDALACSLLLQLSWLHLFSHTQTQTQTQRTQCGGGAALRAGGQRGPPLALICTPPPHTHTHYTARSAMVELRRALEENAACRSPLLGGHQAHAELADLYKLHLLHTPTPRDFAVLLQVRAWAACGLHVRMGCCTRAWTAACVDARLQLHCMQPPAGCTQPHAAPCDHMQPHACACMQPHAHTHSHTARTAGHQPGG